MTQQIFLVTGSSRGIGLGLVRELISQGHKVVATCRNPESALELKNVLNENGQPEPVACDITSDDSIAGCFKQVSEIIPHLDVLINNAGISNKDHPFEPPSKVDRAEFMEIMNANVAGVLAMTKAFLPLLKKGGVKTVGSNVINISSLLGSVELTTDSFTCTSYRCSKAAVNMVTKCFSIENPDLIFVAVHPGWVQTDMGSSKNRQPPVTVPDSAKSILKVASQISKDDSGTFWSFQGNKLPY